MIAEFLHIMFTYLDYLLFNSMTNIGVYVVSEFDLIAFLLQCRIYILLRHIKNILNIHDIIMYYNT